MFTCWENLFFKRWVLSSKIHAIIFLTHALTADVAAAAIAISDWRKPFPLRLSISASNKLNIQKKIERIQRSGG